LESVLDQIVVDLYRSKDGQTQLADQIKRQDTLLAVIIESKE